MSGFPTSSTVGDFLRAQSAQAVTETLAAIEAAKAAPVVAATEGATTKGAPKFAVYKADADTGVIYTIASAAGIEDKDGDTISQADLIKAAQAFCASTERSFNANHGQDHYDLSKATLVESVVGAPILKSGRVLKLGEGLPPASEDPMVGLNIEKGNETHWLIAVDPHNAAVSEVAKKGGIVGASMEATCVKTEVKTDA